MTTSRSHLALCFLWGAKAFIHSQVVDYADNQARIYHLGTIFPPFSQLARLDCKPSPLCSLASVLIFIAFILGSGQVGVLGVKVESSHAHVLQLCDP